MINVEEMSKQRKEPKWMTDLRIKSLKAFKQLPDPNFGPELDIDYDKMIYYSPQEEIKSLKQVPKEMRDTLDKLGLPEFEKKRLAGISVQLDSSVIYEDVLKKIRDKGVIIEPMDKAVRKYDWLKDYFAKLIPYNDHKFAALHTALWSGGVLVRIPKGVTVDIPIQTFFLLKENRISQFEHTIVIAEKGSKVHYIEGCSAPQFIQKPLHVGNVEVFVEDNAKVQFTTIQNWTDKVINLATKRAILGKGAEMKWLSASLGSKTTMLYPTTILKGDDSKVENLAVSFANGEKVLDTGGRAIHIGKRTTSRIINRSVASENAEVNFRGKIIVNKGATGSKGYMKCDSLLLSDNAKSEAYPSIKSSNKEVELAHEATVGRIGKDKLDYLRSRGFSEDESISLLVNGFMEPIVRDIPFEYAIEIRRILDMNLGINN